MQCHESKQKFAVENACWLQTHMYQMIIWYVSWALALRKALRIGSSFFPKSLHQTTSFLHKWNELNFQVQMNHMNHLNTWIRYLQALQFHMERRWSYALATAFPNNSGYCSFDSYIISWELLTCKTLWKYLEYIWKRKIFKCLYLNSSIYIYIYIYILNIFRIVYFWE